MVVDWYFSKDGNYFILLQVCNTVKSNPLHDVNKEIALTGLQIRWDWKGLFVGNDVYVCMFCLLGKNPLNFCTKLTV